MRKKIILSLLALVFCLPMMFAVTACGEDIPKLKSMELDTTNVKTTFYAGEDFSSNGLIVKGVYEDDRETIVMEFTVDSSQFNSQTVGTYTIYVKVDGLTDVYSVSVVADSITGISATPAGKYFIGQEFNTNVDVNLVYASGRSQKITNFTYDEFDSSTAGVKTVTVRYLEESVQINVEVLSNADYAAYVKQKMQAHVVESNNCLPPIFDESEPTATLDYAIETAVAYMNDNLYSVNDGDTWYHTQDGKEIWYDFVDRVLYIDNNVNVYKKSFTNGYDALEFVVNQNIFDGLGDAKALVFLGLYNPEAYFVSLAYAQEQFDIINISLVANELSVTLDSGTQFKFDYNTWQLREYNMGSTYNFKFNSVIEYFPQIPTNAVEYPAA